jgi:U3 small nucleolar RNA-associated protein 20
MLISLDWPGIEQFILPHIAKYVIPPCGPTTADLALRSIVPAMEADPLPALLLLNKLADANLLSTTSMKMGNGRWLSVIVDPTQRMLSQSVLEFHDTPEKRPRLVQILHLIPHLALNEDFIEPLCTLIDKLISGPSPSDASQAPEALRVSWETDVWSDCHIMGRALHCVVQMLNTSTSGPASLKSRLGESGIVNQIITLWSWNREVLSSVATLAEHWPDNIE